MKKILYVASTYGHIKSFHIPYIKRLQELGFQIHVAASGDLGNMEIEGITEINIPFEKKMLSMQNLHCTRKLVRLMEKEQYDIVNVHTSLAAFFTRLAVMLSRKVNLTVINTVHGYLFDENTSWHKKKLMLSAEKLTKGVTNIVEVMNEQDYEIAEKHHLYKDKLIKIPGMGIDTNRFSVKNVESVLCKIAENTSNIKNHVNRENERKKLELGEGDIALIYAAEFSKRKNQKMLIEAMPLLPSNVKLFLAGSGENLVYCKELVKQRQVNVAFLGHVQNLEYYYYLADICVSSSRSEGLPFNIMESMSMGLPIVATKVKGHEDLVAEGINGYLYDFDDQQGFANAVMKLISPNKRIDDFAIRNRQKAQEYRLDKALEVVTGIFLKIENAKDI